MKSIGKANGHNSRRVHKFRAWVHQEMLNVMSINWATEEVTVTWDGHEHGQTYSLSECILMEYTGLDDKSGHEIYEGDIVYDSEWERNAQVLYPVVTHGYPRFVLDWCRTHKDFWDGTHVEVIGNIYQNPELL